MPWNPDDVGCSVQDEGVGHTPTGLGTASSKEGQGLHHDKAY